MQENETLTLYDRQVQDLEKQLLATRQQLTQLQSMVKPEGSVALDDDDDLSQEGPSKRRKLTTIHDFTAIHRNVEYYGRGIISPPRHVEGTMVGGSGSPIETAHTNRWPAELPPLHQGQQLLNDYYATVHQSYPFVHWQRLQSDFDRAYREGLHSLPVDSRGVLLGVFACGALRDSPEHGRPYAEAAWASISFWAADSTMDLIRASMLSTLYLVEMNRMSAAFIMLGAAVRAAQDLGLHWPLPTRSAAEEDSRYDLWWSLYCVERYVEKLPSW